MTGDVKVLFWYQEHMVGVGGYTDMIRWIRYFDAEPVVIDEMDQFYGKEGTTPAALDLDEALAAYPDHQWVFLHPDADTFLDEFEHPDGQVMYAIGSDFDGFGRPVGDLPGVKVKLRNPDEILAKLVVPVVLYDRHLHKLGRRL